MCNGDSPTCRSDLVGDAQPARFRCPGGDVPGGAAITRTLPADGWERLGLRPDGWFRSADEVDWFRPRVTGTLAANRRLPSPARWRSGTRGQTECSPPVPAIERSTPFCMRHCIAGRDYLSETSGACEFFDFVRDGLSDTPASLDPSADAVCDANGPFSKELALLDNELVAYRRDLQRAAHRVVYLPQSTVPFRSGIRSFAITPC